MTLGNDIFGGALQHKCGSRGSECSTAALFTLELISKGSILGPTFYGNYVNDLEVSLRNSKVRLYADNTVTYVSASSPNHACTLLQSDLDKLSNWCEKNRLTVNPSKTKALLFATRHVIKFTTPLTLNDKIL